MTDRQRERETHTHTVDMRQGNAHTHTHTHTKIHTRRRSIWERKRPSAKRGVAQGGVRLPGTSAVCTIAKSAIVKNVAGVFVCACVCACVFACVCVYVRVCFLF